MKKTLLAIASLAILATVTACGRNNNENENTIAELNTTIDQLSSNAAALHSEIAAHQSTIQDLQAQIASYQTENHQLTSQLENPVSKTEDTTLFIYGFTPGDVLNSLIQNLDTITEEINQLIGSPAGDWVRDSILSNKEHIIISPSYVLVYYRTLLPVMLFHHGFHIPTIEGEEITNFYDFDWDIWGSIEWVTDFRWRVAAFGDTWHSLSHMRLAQPPPQRRHLTDLDTVTLGFTDWTRAIDETLVIEEIPGALLWEEAIRLTQYHYGTQVRDIWYDGNILYVDLFPVVGRFNVGLGSIINASYMRQTFEEFPNQTAVRFLVGGERPLPGTGYNGFDINCVPPCPVWMTWGAESPYECICIW